MSSIVGGWRRWDGDRFREWRGIRDLETELDPPTNTDAWQKIACHDISDLEAGDEFYIEELGHQKWRLLHPEAEIMDVRNNSRRWNEYRIIVVELVDAPVKTVRAMVCRPKQVVFKPVR